MAVVHTNVVVHVDDENDDLKNLSASEWVVVKITCKRDTSEVIIYNTDQKNKI